MKTRLVVHSEADCVFIVLRKQFFTLFQNRMINKFQSNTVCRSNRDKKKCATSTGTFWSTNIKVSSKNLPIVTFAYLTGQTTKRTTAEFSFPFLQEKSQTKDLFAVQHVVFRRKSSRHRQKDLSPLASRGTTKITCTRERINCVTETRNVRAINCLATR